MVRVAFSKVMIVKFQDVVKDGVEKGNKFYKMF